MQTGSTDPFIDVRLGTPPAAGAPAGLDVEIVIPVHNEERIISASVLRVCELGMAAPLTRFVGIGAVSTLVYALLFLALAAPLGSVLASAAALAITAVANTAANRRLTFGVRGREGLARQHLAGLVVFMLGWR